MFERTSCKYLGQVSTLEFAARERQFRLHFRDACGRLPPFYGGAEPHDAALGVDVEVQSQRAGLRELEMQHSPPCSAPLQLVRLVGGHLWIIVTGKKIQGR